MAASFTRRTFVAAMTLGGGAMLVGCGRSTGGSTGQSRQPAAGSGEGSAMPPRNVAMTVYRDPGCGCCEAWADLARKAGFNVDLVNRTDMPAVKRRYGVPEELASCHTAVVEGFVIEGHVPLADVDHLLEERPSRVRGLAVPGMPRGSPGMEMPDGSKDPFAVMAFNAAGQSSLFHS